MTRASPNYAMACGWNALLPPRDPAPPLSGEYTADVVIIGAGFTGLACARRWQELSPDARIVVLDASEIGEGNAGRNSGFLLDIALADDADSRSTDRMAACNALTREAMQGIVADVQRVDADIDLHKAGTYRAAASAPGLRSLDAYQAFLDAAGLPYRRLTRQDLRRELGTEFYEAGLYSPDCYLAQPAAVIRAIAKVLPDSITLYEYTQARSLHRHGQTWRVDAGAGAINCQRVVLANNAFARDLGVARSRLASVYTYAGLTEPLEEVHFRHLGTNENWGILPTHRLGSTLRRTLDGRLLLRSLHDYEREQSVDTVREALKARLAKRFPDLKAVDFEHVWGGAVGFTYNAAPVWGEHEPDLFLACGCNGGGTVKGTLFGKLLAELAHGQPVPDVAGLFGKASYMPPDPLRDLAFRAQAAFESWQGRHEL